MSLRRSATFAAGLLRRHISCGAEDHPRLRDAGCERGRVHDIGRGIGFCRLGEAEVQDLDRAVRGDPDVGRLQISMNDALLVRRLDPVDQLTDDREHRVEPQRPGGRLAFDELEHEVIRADVVEVADVRMVQSRNEARLAREPVRELDRGDFDGDVALETRIAGSIHLSHAAGPDETGHFIRAEMRAGCERH
jgi:hypothetical protein